jgi:carbamoyl-phosphate synthase large subunit
MRDASLAVIREIGVETGGSNIQFAVDPTNGRLVVIEMNPRVSRSSALASKATGFPIAKIAAKLAVGYTLDEIPNDITQKTPACFEPTIDYCVVKIPRFTFEKFPDADPLLTISMKSVGETMAIGRTFKEALQKGLRSLEIKVAGLDDLVRLDDPKALEQKLKFPGAQRIFYVKQALKEGMGIDKVYQLSKIDPWFLDNINQLIEYEEKLKTYKNNKVPTEILREAKAMGFSDTQLAKYWGLKEEAVYKLRQEKGVMPEYKLVDTCAAEFEAYTPYYYSTYS